MTVQQVLLRSGANPPVVRKYGTIGSGVETTLSGFKYVRIWAVGSGGAGRFILSGESPTVGASGAAGGACESVYAISGGETINYTISYGGYADATTSGFGGDTTVYSGTLSITTMVAYGGNSGSGLRANAYASGGNVANYNGEWQNVYPNQGSRTSPMIPSGTYDSPWKDVADKAPYSTYEYAGFGAPGAWYTGAGDPGWPGCVYFLYHN